MKLKPDNNFWEQQERYRLQYTCEACAFFDLPSQKCSHGWPNAEHRAKRYRRFPNRIVFCKEFELA